MRVNRVVISCGQPRRVRVTSRGGQWPVVRVRWVRWVVMSSDKLAKVEARAYPRSARCDARVCECAHIDIDIEHWYIDSGNKWAKQPLTECAISLSYDSRRAIDRSSGGHGLRQDRGRWVAVVSTGLRAGRGGRRHQWRSTVFCSFRHFVFPIDSAIDVSMTACAIVWLYWAQVLCMPYMQSRLVLLCGPYLSTACPRLSRALRPSEWRSIERCGGRRRCDQCSDDCQTVSLLLLCLHQIVETPIEWTSAPKLGSHWWVFRSLLI